jgi:DNA-binding transcriptional MerR regulator
LAKVPKIFSNFPLTLTLRDSLCLYRQSNSMENYSVKKLSDLAGVSVRTLHLYDEIGLLKPSVRTAAGYRLYGEKELLRLQQILFYKELDFSLQEIAAILDDPEFDIVHALENHKQVLSERSNRLSSMLITIDKTINKIKNGTIMKHEELYAGLPKETAEAWRSEAIEKYGKETIERSEKSLLKMTKEDFTRLGSESMRLLETLASMIHENPESSKVQDLIAQHYIVIRKLWGTHGSVEKQAEAYAGLGELYVADERYTMINGKPNVAFADFMKKAMKIYSDNNLR